MGKNWLAQAWGIDGEEAGIANASAQLASPLREIADPGLGNGTTLFCWFFVCFGFFETEFSM